MRLWHSNCLIQTMKLPDLIKELQKDFELKEPFAENPPGVFDVPVDEDVMVTVREVPGGMVLSASFVDMPLGKEEELYLNLLYANLMGQGTRGAILALSEDGRRLILSRVIDYDVNFKEFRDIFEDFISTVDYWRDEVLTLGNS